MLHITHCEAPPDGLVGFTVGSLRLVSGLPAIHLVVCFQWTFQVGSCVAIFRYLFFCTPAGGSGSALLSALLLSERKGDCHRESF